MNVPYYYYTSYVFFESRHFATFKVIGHKHCTYSPHSVNVFTRASILLLVRKQRVSFDLDFLSDKNIAQGKLPEDILRIAYDVIRPANYYPRKVRSVKYCISCEKTIEKSTNPFTNDSHRGGNSRTSCFRKDIAITEELRVSIGATST